MEGTGRTLNWTYDKIYRLTNEAVSNDPANKNGSVNYLLDPVGNRKSSTSTLSGVSPESFTYTADDELTTDLYDNNGNTTVSGANSFTYDSENELKTMNGGAVTLLYDGDGNRVAKTVGGVTTRYLVDDVNPTGLPQVVEETVNGVVQRQYTYGSQLISENQFTGGVGTASFYQTDGTGSVRQLTNSAGAVTDTYDYDAFGNKVNSTGTTPNNYLYRSEQYDADLSLYYLRARYYNPTTGRFLNVDPEAGEGQRRYEYVAADPVNGMDPTGNEALTEFLLLQFRPLPIMSWPKWCQTAPDWVKSLFGCAVPPPPPPHGPPPPSPPPSPHHGPPPPAPNKIAKAICGAIPSGRTTGASGGLGGIGSVGGGLETVVNYSSGQVSGFSFGGVQVGWNGGASGSVYSGYVYGLNGSNSNYSGGFTGFNGGAGPGVFGASSSGGLTGGVSGLGVNPLAPGAVTSGGLSFGGGLLSGFAGGVTATNYSNPIQMGKFWAFDVGDWSMYAAKQACKTVGFY